MCFPKDALIKTIDKVHPIRARQCIPKDTQMPMIVISLCLLRAEVMYSLIFLELLLRDPDDALIHLQLCLLRKILYLCYRLHIGHCQK